MNNRIFTLDYIRVFAMMMILLCHYYQNSEICNGVDRYLGDVGNIVFFLLSALLYGGRLNTDNPACSNSFFNYKHFFCKKIIKLASSLWPFLILIVGLYLVFKVPFSWLDVGLNFALLGYLGKLPGNGHLWFLTILMACYIEYMFCYRTQIKKDKFPYIYLLLMIAIMIFSEYVNFPGNAFAILGFYGFVLMKHNAIINNLKKIGRWLFIPIISFNIIQLHLEMDNLFLKSRIIHYLLSNINGLLLLFLLLWCMPKVENKLISWFSSISFEIYIVHHTLCAGPFIRISSLTEYHILNFLIFLLLSIVLAYILNIISKKILEIVDYKLTGGLS